MSSGSLATSLSMVILPRIHKHTYNHLISKQLGSEADKERVEYLTGSRLAEVQGCSSFRFTFYKGGCCVVPCLYKEAV